MLFADSPLKQNKRLRTKTYKFIVLLCCSIRCSAMRPQQGQCLSFLAMARARRLCCTFHQQTLLTLLLSAIRG